MDTSLLHVLRPKEWPPRESNERGARGIEFSVHQSNPFRRATISRRAALATVRAGTPQNTSSSVSRAYSRTGGGRRNARPIPSCSPTRYAAQGTCQPARLAQHAHHFNASDRPPSLQHYARARAHAHAHVFRPARARAGAPFRSRHAVTMRGRPTRMRPSTTTRVLSSSGASSRRATACECSARTRIPYGVGPRRALRRVDRKASAVPWRAPTLSTRPVGP